MSPGATIFLVAGTRPNFMKIAPILSRLKRQPFFRPVLIHTGRHYDDAMSQVFFRDMKLAPPEINLQIGSGSQARQTGQIMRQLERVVLQRPPDLVMVVGDDNSTVAGSLVAAKLHIPVAHVEAGLRTFDRRMPTERTPEEINRILADTISDYLFTTCRDANETLLHEGIPEEKIYFVGNVMADSLLAFRQKAQSSSILKSLKLQEREYGLMTLQRSSNVDNRETLGNILRAVEQIQEELPIVFPIHPRSRKMLRDLDLEDEIDRIPRLRIIDPVGHIDFFHLMDHARLVLTDSVGIQEETTILGVPCLTLRENTELPVTVREGTNRVVGSDPERIVHEAKAVLRVNKPKSRRPKFWDGSAAERIVDILSKNLAVIESSKKARKE